MKHATRISYILEEIRLRYVEVEIGGHAHHTSRDALVVNEVRIIVDIKTPACREEENMIASSSDATEGGVVDVDCV